MLVRHTERTINKTPSPGRAGALRKTVARGVTLTCCVLIPVAIFISPVAFRHAKPLESARLASTVVCLHGMSPFTIPSVGAKDVGEANARASVPLFFGYVEFDWDPDRPGGVPGFGPLPPPTGPCRSSEMKASS